MEAESVGQLIKSYKQVGKKRDKALKYLSGLGRDVMDTAGNGLRELQEQMSVRDI